jgi:hypothetical protein
MRQNAKPRGVRDIVVTLTVNVAARDAFTFTLAGGGGQVAPMGAPVQLSAAVPVNPPPPMARA